MLTWNQDSFFYLAKVYIALQAWAKETKLYTCPVNSTHRNYYVCEHSGDACVSSQQIDWMAPIGQVV